MNEHDKENVNPSTIEGSNPPAANEIPAEVASNEKTDKTQQETSPRNVHGLQWFLVVLSLLSSTFFFGYV